MASEVELSHILEFWLQPKYVSYSSVRYPPFTWLTFKDVTSRHHYQGALLVQVSTTCHIWILGFGGKVCKSVQGILRSKLKVWSHFVNDAIGWKSSVIFIFLCDTTHMNTVNTCILICGNIKKYENIFVEMILWFSFEKILGDTDCITQCSTESQMHLNQKKKAVSKIILYHFQRRIQYPTKHLT